MNNDLPDHLASHLRICTFGPVARYFEESLQTDSWLPAHRLYFVSNDAKIEDAAATVIERQREDPMGAPVTAEMLNDGDVLFGYPESRHSSSHSLGVDVVPDEASCTVLCADRSLFVQFNDPGLWPDVRSEQQRVRLAYELRNTVEF